MIQEGAEHMELHLSADVQAKLEQMARDAGRPPAEVIEDAVIGLYDELAYTRELLNRRYDEMETGKVEGIDGEDAYRRLMEKTEARRQRRPA
jgi:predicted transcriptional regulator